MKIFRKDTLMYLVVGLFCLSTFVNFWAFVFGSSHVHIFGFLCSSAYLLSWFLSAYLFRNRRGWIKFLLYMRWITVGVLIFVHLAEMFHAQFGFSGFLNIMQMFSAAVVFPVYCGFDLINKDQWISIAAVVLQAVTVTVLYLRLRRNRTETAQ